MFSSELYSESGDQWHTRSKCLRYCLHIIESCDCHKFALRQCYSHRQRKKQCYYHEDISHNKKFKQLRVAGFMS